MVFIVRTTSFIAFALSALFVLSSFTPAFGQGSAEKPDARLAEIKRQAEELFLESLNLSGTGEQETARLKLLEAMRLWTQIGEPERAARAALQMADSYKWARRFQESLYYYNLVLETQRLSDSMRAVACNSVAEIYSDAREVTLALPYYSKALDHAQKARDFQTQTLALAGLAELYHRRRDRANAIASLAKAQQLNRQQGDEAASATLLTLSGRINQEEGLTEQARQAFEDALVIFQRTGDAEGEVKTRSLLSNLYLSSGQKQVALEHAERAVELAENQADRAVTNAETTRARDLRWPAWLSLGRAQRSVGQTQEAVKSFSRAIRHVEGVWWLVYVFTEASATGFREECQAPYRELIDLLIEQERFAEAYDWAKRLKARALLGLIQGRRTGAHKKSGQEDALREQSRQIGLLRSQLLSSQISPKQQEKLQKEISNAEQAMREAKVRGEMETARERVAWFQTPEIKQLQERLDPDKRAILEFSLGEDRSFVWLISSEDISVEVLPGRKKIEKEVGEYLNLISAAPNNRYIKRDMSQIRDRAGRLLSGLLGRLSDRLVPGRKLIVVPDGVLHYLSFEALVHNERFLLQDHEISYLPSASMLGAWQHSKRRDETEARMEFLAFGDPIFRPGPEASDGKRAGGGTANISRQVRAVREFRLTRLPWTSDEVNYIAGLFPADRRRVHLGADSLERAVKQAPLHRYRRIHFATHGLPDELTPGRSAIVLTLNNDPEEDGFLEASEISELSLDSDLVVLSACRTGRGQLISGEGIVGLSRAFLYAGARSVVVSLWNVSDISTGLLMKNFYQRLVSNAANAAALREAKLQMLESGTEAQHPYYWAPFVVIGKP